MGNLFERMRKSWESASADPELDKTKEALKDLRGKTSSELLEGRLAALDADLSELNLSQEQRERLKQTFVRDALSRSPEAANLNAFVDQFADYTGLAEVIRECKKKDSNEPMRQLIRTAKASTPLLAGLGIGLLSRWLKGETPETEKQPGALEEAADAADATVNENRKKKKKKKKRNKGEKSESADTEESPPPSENESAPARREASNTSPQPERTTVNVEVQGRGPSYALPERYKVKAKSLEEFQETLLSIRNRHLRNAYIAFQVAAGFVPPSLRNLHTVTVKGKNPDGTHTVLTFDVTKTGIRVGEDGLDENGKPKSVEVSLDGATAQAAATALGYRLIRPEMERMIYNEARTNSSDLTLRAGMEIARADNQPASSFAAYMLGPEALLTVNRLRQQDMASKGLTYDRLIAGHFKSVVEPTTAGIIDIRGGADAHGNTIQKRTTFHDDPMASYNDAPQGVRVFNPESIRIDGQPVTYEALMSNPELRRTFGFNEQTAGLYTVPQDLQAAIKPTEESATATTDTLQ